MKFAELMWFNKHFNWFKLLFANISIMSSVTLGMRRHFILMLNSVRQIDIWGQDFLLVFCWEGDTERRGNIQIHLASSVERELRCEWPDSCCKSLWLNSGLQLSAPSLLSAPATSFLQSHYRWPSLLMGQESLAILITNLQTSHLLYLFSRQDLPRFPEAA